MSDAGAARIDVLTLNPTIDVSYEVPRLVEDRKVPATDTRYDPGGNGINVGRALEVLDVPGCNHCLVAGEIGEFLERLLVQHIGDVRYVRLREGSTRICCTILQEQPAAQFEVSAVGPVVDSDTLARLESGFLEHATGLAVLTGSLPRGVPEDIYARLARALTPRGVRVVVDAHGKVLERAVREKLFLVKPNRYELEGLGGGPLDSLPRVIDAARALQARGIEYVCVSLGADGAVLVGPQGRAWRAETVPVRTRSTVGAGDSMVAGLVAAFARGGDPRTALAQGVACGSGTAAKPGTALFTRQDIARTLGKVAVREVAS